MGIAEASAAPRLHHQWFPDEVLLERGYSPDTVRILKRRGHQAIYRVAPMVGYGASDLAGSSLSATCT
jgi:gamma-glutamyltranspeptidase/glutathione hydrolase